MRTIGHPSWGGAPCAAVVSAAVLACAIAAGASAAPRLSVSDAWSRPAVAGTTGVGYLTVTNSSDKADALTKVESAAASRVEMHSVSLEGGVMRMASETRVAVPAGDRTRFAPGGYHLMLIGLTRTIRVGDTIPATLTFASGARLTTRLTVTLTPPGSGARP